MTGRDFAPLDQESARAALDELFTLAGKYNSSDAYHELMRFIGRFRFYSPFNAMLIHAQMPGAHFVCTARRWQKDYHRKINVSAKPIAMGANATGARFDVEPKMTSRNINVISISETNAAPTE